MPVELGERLVEVGLVTRAQLGRHAAAPHGAALARRLVDAGLVEDALAGFFLSEGFGPLVARGELREADPRLLSSLPPAMAWDFLVFPLRETRSGVLVAMAVPSDRHLVRETARLLGKTVLPTVVRLGDLLSELGARFPEGAPAEARHDSEPPVLQLVRRREPKASASQPGQPAQPAQPTQPTQPTQSAQPVPPQRAAFEPVLDDKEDDVPVPLVRHKPVASKPVAHVVEQPVKAPVTPAPVAAKPANPASANPNAAPANKVGPLLQKTFPAPQGRAESKAAFRTAERKVTTSEYEVARKAAAGPISGETSIEGASISAAPEPPSSPPVEAPELAPELGKAAASEAAQHDELVKSDRWDLPAPQPRPDSKVSVSRASLPSSKAAAGDVAPVLASMKSARDRDSIVRLACEGAVTISRSAVFLALRKGVLKGWDGAGQGVSRDSVRNLWIPAGSESMFKRVLDSGAPFVGAYGQGIADGLFRAAVGSRGGDVAVWPVSLEGKVVGLLCVDDLRPGSISRHRIETLTVAIAEGFRRLISTGKNE